MQKRRKPVFVALLAALTVALGFLLTPVPNIELVTFSLFLSGYLLGLGSGLLTALVALLIFYGFNPYGSSIGFPPLFAAQIVAGLVIASLGGFFRCLYPPEKNYGWRRPLALIPFAGVASLCLTQIPMLLIPLLGTGPWQGWIALGTMMTITSFLFNMVIFMVGFEPLVCRIARLRL